MELLMAFGTSCGIMALILAISAGIRLDKIEKQLSNKD